MAPGKAAATMAAGAAAAAAMAPAALAAGAGGIAAAAAAAGGASAMFLDLFFLNQCAEEAEILLLQKIAVGARLLILCLSYLKR
jgi:hypothetical protein